MVDRHLAERVLTLTGNEVCLFGSTPMPADVDGLTAFLLDPAVRIGTSTPGADPGGDYAWQVFRRIDARHPGSFDILDQKTMQLVGKAGWRATPGSTHPVVELFQKGVIDVFLGYLTTALHVKKQLDTIELQRLPQSICVRAVYGMAPLLSFRPDTHRLIDFLFSPEGQAIFSRHGFSSVPMSASRSFLTSPPAALL